VDKTTRSVLSQTSLVTELPSEGVAAAGSLPLMKMEGVKPVPPHIRERLKKTGKPVVKVKDMGVVVGGANDDQDSLHKENDTSSTEEKGSRRGCSRVKGHKVKKNISNTLPRVTIRTINMKMSNIDKGEAYACGSGIIEEHSSFLEITSQS